MGEFFPSFSLRTRDQRDEMKTLRASKKRFSESPLREGESNSREDKSGEYRWLAAYEIVIRSWFIDRPTKRKILISADGREKIRVYKLGKRR